MKLRLIFGEESLTREINWWKDVKEFPHLISYGGSNYGWYMYEISNLSWVTYDLHFSKVPEYDKLYHASAPTVDELTSGWGVSRCECGADKTDFPQVHMFYCPKWKDIM